MRLKVKWLADVSIFVLLNRMKVDVRSAIPHSTINAGSFTCKVIILLLQLFCFNLLWRGVSEPSSPCMKLDAHSHSYF
jgi:hypothetical protein